MQKSAVLIYLAAKAWNVPQNVCWISCNLFSGLFWEKSFYINIGENFNYYTVTIYSSSVPTIAEAVDLNVQFVVHTHLFIGSLCSVIVKKW
jgi:hypothetical protein